MKKSIRIIAFSLIIAPFIFISSCKDKHDDHSHDDDAPGTGEIEFMFEHKFGSSPFTLNSDNYFVTSSQDSIKFRAMNYYVSNIILHKEDGGTWVQPESYHLVKLGTSSIETFKISNVPTGKYVGVTYTIGVDSTRNVSGAQTGALDPVNSMFWSWNTGYIFIKAEGTSPQSTGTDNDVTFHVGGFNNALGNNAVQTKHETFGGDVLELKKSDHGHGHGKSIHYHIHIDKLFDGDGGKISLDAINRIKMPGDNAQIVAKNFISAFKVDHIH